MLQTCLHAYACSTQEQASEMPWYLLESLVPSLRQADMLPCVKAKKTLVTA